MNRFVCSLPIVFLSLIVHAADVPGSWMQQWPETDFSQVSVPLQEILPGGPGKDGIPSIDNPVFLPVGEVENLDDDEAVIGLTINGDARAYPLRILMWHEIVNDQVGGVPVTITYCPLCNTSIVFERTLSGQVLSFGTTGNLRHSDLVMYDRQTESWWQQYSGHAIVGELNGERLAIVPSRLESFSEFRQRNSNGQVLIPNAPRARPYGSNPYVGYDQAPRPPLYQGSLPVDIAPMMRVVAIDDLAITLPLMRELETVQYQGMTISWHSGQRSALDDIRIDRGANVGSVKVTRDGQDLPYVVTFAFAFLAFHPEGRLIQDVSEL